MIHSEQLCDQFMINVINIWISWLDFSCDTYSNDYFWFDFGNFWFDFDNFWFVFCCRKKNKKLDIKFFIEPLFNVL